MMTIWLVTIILLAAMLLLITEKLPVDLVEILHDELIELPLTTAY